MSAPVPVLPAAIAPTVLAEIAAVIGTAHLEYGEAERERASRTTEPDQRLCGAVAHPADAAEVQAVVRICARHGVPVWPVSRGNNWGYGTRNALQPGALILQLDRLNRIEFVDPELAYAVVGPGVTQAQLSAYLKTHHPHLWVDVNDATPLASVVGNALERGYGCTEQGDRWANLCGLDVVLGDGSLLATGGPLGDRARARHTHPHGLGPSLQGLFGQSNLGVVVRAGVWLVPRPVAMRLWIFEASSDTAMRAAVDALREAGLRHGCHGTWHCGNDIATLTVLLQRPPLPPGTTRMDAALLAGLRARFRVAPWTLYAGLYGTRAAVADQRRALTRLLKPHGRIEFFGDGKVRAVDGFLRRYDAAAEGSFARRALGLLRRVAIGHPLEKLRLLSGTYHLHRGIPDDGIARLGYFRSRAPAPAHGLDPARDNAGSIWHAPAVPMRGRELAEAQALVLPVYERFGFDPSLCLTRMNARTCFLLCGVFFDREDAEERTRAAACHAELVRVTAAAGFQAYRGGLAHFPGLNADAPVLSRILAGLKNTCDPHSVIAPGKYGI